MRIDPIGQVEANGSLTVTPADSTKYHLVAEGPGGVDVSTVWVTVTIPPLASAVVPLSPGTEEGVSALLFQSIFFDNDRYAIRPDQQQGLENDGQLLLQHPELQVVIEGNCDDRGSTSTT